MAFIRVLGHKPKHDGLTIKMFLTSQACFLSECTSEVGDVLPETPVVLQFYRLYALKFTEARSLHANDEGNIHEGVDIKMGRYKVVFVNCHLHRLNRTELDSPAHI